MIYRKNLPGWERAARVIARIAMIAWGLIGFPGALFPGRSAARSDVLQSRDPFFLVGMDPGSAEQRCTLRRVRDTRELSAARTLSIDAAFATACVKR